jgi:polysaccharide export outer membrane protein
MGITTFVDQQIERRQAKRGGAMPSLYHPQKTSYLAMTGLLACFILVQAGCSSSTTNPPTPESIASRKPSGPSVDEINKALTTMASQAPSSSSDYQIGPEDLLNITIYNIMESNSGLTPRTVMVRVSQQGAINLPLLGELPVKGMTVSALEQKLRELYDKYIHFPQIGVLVAEYRQKVSIVGAVQKSGEFVISGPKTLIDVLAMAGGVTTTAGTQAHLYRRGPNGQQTFIIDLLVLASNPGSYNDKTLNQPLEPGDVINVPQAGMFFVDGAVRSPGSFPLGRRFTLTQALAIAGGMDRDLSSSEVSIYRKTGSHEIQTISVNFDEILAGKAVDPPIESDDVIIVPISSAKYVWNKYLAQIIFGGVSVRSFVPGPR